MIFEELTIAREDLPELVASMRDAVDRLSGVSGEVRDAPPSTSGDHPGMLLGKIQAGKTRAFIGIIARAFDEGFDFAIILTKGTQALSEQTIKRVNRDFAVAIEDDRVKVYDIMHLPKNLTKYHLRQKWVIIVKKEKNNLRRVFEALEEHYPDLKEKRLLIVDDEADYATLAFRKNKDTDEIEPGKIAAWIDDRGMSAATISLTKAKTLLRPRTTPFTVVVSNAHGGLGRAPSRRASPI